MKARQSNCCSLFSVQTVPVPVDKPRPYFTQLKVENEYLAINNMSHTELNQRQLSQCLKMSDKTICLQNLIEFEYIDQSCLSMIFYEKFTRSEIKNKCKFDVLQAEQVAGTRDSSGQRESTFGKHRYTLES